MITSNILPIWQPVAHSTHIIAKNISKKRGVLTSHTGTLDPMAEGVIIILLGEDRHKKYEYAKWKKGYEFEMIFGISTDTYDGLGMINTMELPTETIKKKQIETALGSIKGAYKQNVPPYSAIKVKGKPMHWYARNNKLEEITEIWPVREGTIFDIKLISLSEETLSSILRETITTIKKISGDLRQQEIINQWNTLIADEKIANTRIQTAKVYVETSKGLYVRGISQDICKELDTIGFVTKLTRVKNGEYNKTNCQKL